MKRIPFHLGWLTILVFFLFSSSAFAQNASENTDPLEEIELENETAAHEDAENNENNDNEDTENAENAENEITIEGGSYEPVDVPRFSAPDQIWGSGEVVIIEITGMIDLGLAPYVARSIEEAEDAALIILHVNTFGGRVDAAVQIRDAVLGASAPTLAYVDRRAISAGALISLAADFIVFAPGGSLGAATPVQVSAGEASPVEEKHVSYMRAEIRSTAEAKGRRGDIAEAMVDARLAVDDLIDGERLLTLTSDQAYTFGFSDGEEATLSDVLSSAGLASRETRESKKNWAEIVARIITNPTIAGILMSLGILGLMIELYSPGLGFPGIIGVTSLVAFIFGHNAVHLVGMEEVILLGVGFLLLTLEFFILPGFGFAGGIGVLAIMAALVLSLIGLPLNIAWELGSLQAAITQVGIVLFVVTVLMTLLIGYLPERAIPNWLMLRTSIKSTSQEDDETKSDPRQMLVGKVGIAISPLRPIGRGDFNGKLIDISSTHGVIRQGDRVRITEVNGPSIFVELITSITIDKT